MFSFSKSFEKGKEVKKGRMFTAAEVRALDEAKSAKNYKKKVIFSQSFKFAIFLISVFVSSALIPAFFLSLEILICNKIFCFIFIVNF